MVRSLRSALFLCLCLFGFVGAAAGQSGTTPLKNVIGLAQGSEHACTIGSSGQLYCWGRNTRGQLGDNSVNDRSVAAPVVGLASATQFTVGGYTQGPPSPFPPTRYAHTCAFDLTLPTQLKCWGGNESGQLGDGTTTDRLTAVNVTGLTDDLLQVAAGGRHTCVLTVNGGVKCWGLNDSGQLGDGTTNSRSMPTDVAGLSSGVRFLVAAYKHTCAAMTAGGVKCWGSNDTGQLGDGTTIDRLTPTDVVGLPASQIDFISAGGGDTYNEFFNPTPLQAGSETCVVANNQALCWGHGALSPVQRATDVRTIAARQGNLVGRITSCCQSVITRSCAVRTDFSVACWDFYSDSIHHSGTLQLTDRSHTVTTGEGWGACALVGFNQLDGFSDHVECVVGTLAGVSGTNSTVLTTASGLNPQSITFGTPPPTVIANVGDSLALTISAGGSGNPVILNSTTPSICSISGNTVTGLAQGKCIITADQAGNSQYEAAPQTTLVLRVGDPLPQTITFGTAPTVVVGGSGTVSATATSGGTVTFQSNTPSACSVSGNVVIGIAAGTCIVSANQNGDFFYAAAPQATQSFTIGTGRATAYALTATALLLDSSGSGIITGAAPIASSPAGIDCGATCTGSFPAGTQVTLTARPPTGGFLPQMIFAGWSGPCTGLGPCVVTMDANKTAQANFVSYNGTLALRYRLYSPATAEHLYTSDEFEYRYLSNQVDPACCGWTAEGAIYDVLAGPGRIGNSGSVDIVDAVPLYRLYNPYSHQHHWTIALNEYNYLGTIGWQQEGIAQYVFPRQALGTVPLYRLYLNAFGGLHLWTTDIVERDYLMTSAGWVYEGVAAYVIPLQP